MRMGMQRTVAKLSEFEFLRLQGHARGNKNKQAEPFIHWARTGCGCWCVAERYALEEREIGNLSGHALAACSWDAHSGHALRACPRGARSGSIRRRKDPVTAQTSKKMCQRAGLDGVRPRWAKVARARSACPEWVLRVCVRPECIPKPSRVRGRSVVHESAPHWPVLHAHPFLTRERTRAVAKRQMSGQEQMQGQRNM